jgi:TRAP-type uncharacterized transport system fused permease subunit
MTTARPADGYDDLVEGLIAGARNMIGIGIATATAGIIVGAVSQTGVGLVLADLVEMLSHGQPAADADPDGGAQPDPRHGAAHHRQLHRGVQLLAPVVVTLGSRTALIVPLIAVHLFVFYLRHHGRRDAAGGAGIVRGGRRFQGAIPSRPAITAFYYSLRTAALPFLFIFNTDLLLIDVDWPTAC